ncbi:hypothetical protein ACFXGR_43865 [Streptomyces mirabilis]|uniref:hypothetical protein n=1 Tax=Streptomyces mirabilis TaxID=68239 RepID=UPI00367BB485
MAQQGRIARARHWWTSTPRLIRRFSAVLLLVGAALAGGGLWLDGIDWWQGHDFLINLASSLTSLCFGVPTALLVLSHLGNAQADARQTRRARESAIQEIHDFRRALAKAFRVTSTADLTDKLRGMQEELRELRLQPAPDRAEATARFFDSFNDLLMDPGSPGHRPTDWAALSRDGRQWGQMRTWHVRVESQWKILSDEVRPRVTDCGLPWIEKTPATEAEQAARLLLSEDRRNPWRMRPDFNETAGITAMGHFVRDLWTLCDAAEYLATLYPSLDAIHAP